MDVAAARELTTKDEPRPIMDLVHQTGDAIDRLFLGLENLERDLDSILGNDKRVEVADVNRYIQPETESQLEELLLKNLSRVNDLFDRIQTLRARVRL